ncbi:uncharacterized protein OCT59_010512 [Rhizophagus irregularis]|uniref:uncharacterized protein n=1 Tax=Rhizophagus irregularis TaxID=588596 RepID=UPI00332643F2|nr:hypothetical protein OCT59_010512 [Rhizophagus irregularis]
MLTNGFGFLGGISKVQNTKEIGSKLANPIEIDSELANPIGKEIGSELANSIGKLTPIWMPESRREISSDFGITERSMSGQRDE